MLFLYNILMLGAGIFLAVKIYSQNSTVDEGGKLVICVGMFFWVAVSLWAGIDTGSIVFIFWGIIWMIISIKYIIFWIKEVIEIERTEQRAREKEIEEIRKREKEQAEKAKSFYELCLEYRLTVKEHGEKNYDEIICFARGKGISISGKEEMLKLYDEGSKVWSSYAEELKQNMEYADFYKKVVACCQILDFKNISDEELKKIELVKRNYFPDFNDSQRRGTISAILEKGKEVCEWQERKKEEKNRILNLQRKADDLKKADDLIKEIHDKSKDITTKRGYEKYTFLTKEEIARLKKKEEELKQAKEATRILGAALYSSAGYVEPEKDNWAIAGGIASAIGGPVAGAMAASQIMNENARREEQARANAVATRQFAEDFHRNYVMPIMSMTFSGDYQSLQRKVDRFNKLLLDDLGSKEEDLEINVKGYDITEEGNVIVRLQVQVTNNNIEILGKPAILDGNYRIDVKKGNEIIGEGFFSGLGYGIMNLSKAGIQSGEYEIPCYCEKEKIKKDDKVDIDIKMLSLWYIQKN